MVTIQHGDISLENSKQPLKPTKADVENTSEIPIVIQECLQGKVDHVSRQPHESDFVDMVKFGNVFLHEKNASGFETWQDGLVWKHNWGIGSFTIEAGAMPEAKVWTADNIPKGLARLTGSTTIMGFEHNVAFYFDYSKDIPINSEDETLEMYCLTRLRELWSRR